MSAAAAGLPVLPLTLVCRNRRQFLMTRSLITEKGDFVRTRTDRLAVVPALLAASIAALAGCTHSGDTAARSTPSAVAFGLPAVVPNDAAARKNVTVSSCKATNDGWEASGTATNPASKQTDYTVTVFFTTTGATVVGTGQSKVSVKPGAQQHVAAMSCSCPYTQFVAAPIPRTGSSWLEEVCLVPNETSRATVASIRLGST